MNKIKEEYLRWLDFALEDADVAEELKSLNDEEIEDAFYRELEFGTGGLRGVIGAGTNRMNIYTVAKATQGLANYLKSRYDSPSAVIGYDSRKKSDLFAKIAAEVFSANGIQVHIWRELMPVPTVSFAVRSIGASAGVMITASHNPAKYNGYKVYGSDGCQITTDAASEIINKINNADIFGGVMRESFDEGIKNGKIAFISEKIYDGFIENVKAQSQLFGDGINRNLSIVYTPLNGTGLKPVLRVLTESGFTDIKVVKEQEHPDGDFPTCPYPNPEIKEALSLGIEYAKLNGAELLLASDPDCDRVGIAVKDGDEYVLLSGNETGLLLFDYILSQRKKHNKMPSEPVMIKTIVTADTAELIADKYGVKTLNVLTGFKFIGEEIGILEREGKSGSYIFGFEESYGYLSGTYVRDKDGVGAAFLICEMAAFYKTRGISLKARLNELYKEFGYCLNTLNSFSCEGASGFEKMQNIMKALRGEIKEISGKKVLNVYDYKNGISGLPKSDVLKFILEGGSSVVVRPSGTEPKIKIYISVRAQDKNSAKSAEEELLRDLICRLSYKF